jgi:MFS family permease
MPPASTTLPAPSNPPANREAPFLIRELFGLREFRFFIAANVAERFAASAMTVLLGYQIFELTGRTLFVGLLGLTEAIPGVTLVLLGGDFADRHDRRAIMLRTTTLLAALALILAAVARLEPSATLPALFAVAFLSATVRAFESPAATGLEARVLPRHLVFRGVPVLATSARTADVLGPVAVGFAWAWAGPVSTYAALAALFLLASTLLRLGVAPKPPAPTATGLSPTTRILEGVGYVFRHPVLWASMALDLFAVFFGGVTALLPYFATETLGVGAEGFGLMRSSMAAGSLLAAALCTRLLPRRHAGLVLHATIACFGLCIIVFGLSRSFPLSLAALFLSGVCDGVSVVIRNTILRLASPEALRGRIAAVKSVFVGSSNELGALESGLLAAAIGAVPTVLAGGAVTLAVVFVIAWRAPTLRRMNLERLTAPAP